MTGAIVGVLALAATALVVLALRPVAADREPIAPFEIGAVAALGESQWRWVGPSNCNVDADVVPFQRRPDGGDWTPSATPLTNVYGLSFRNEQDGISTGTTKQCARG